jgi:putative PIN family toxin of toxin-antitoxin system
MRAVLDTNVLVSALLFRRNASALHREWRSGHVVLLVSDRTIAELAAVLAYPKFRLPRGAPVALVAGEILPFTQRVDPRRDPRACRDPGDDEFLWVARDGRADALVTGDTDLLALGPTWSGIRVVTVANVVAELTTRA